MAQERLALKTLSDQDLSEKVRENKGRLKKIQFSHAISPIENPTTIRLLKREIAQLKTEQRRREIEGGK